jgi:NAD+ synthase (glutamine-hydrolysing)
MRHGFVRVAAAVPTLRVADPAFNADRTLALLERAEAEGVEVVVFPEVGLTGYTCYDLFHQATLTRIALRELDRLVGRAARAYRGLAVVGLPVIVDDRLFNAAAVFARGQVLGVIPKSYLPNYKEFYDARYYAAAQKAVSDSVALGSGEAVPFGTDLLFTAAGDPPVGVGVEICEDLWVPVPPSSWQALAGANLLLNLSASNEVVGKAPYRRQLVGNQSGRCIAGYVYSSCGVHESTTDLVFGGHCLIAENGTILEESPRFRRDDALTVADIDLGRLRADRIRTTTFSEPGASATGFPALTMPPIRRIAFSLDPTPPDTALRRKVDAHPFVPTGAGQLDERCDEIFHTQVAGLAKRLEHVGSPHATIGVSGGLDSTLALLVACKTMDALARPRSHVLGFTLPGFGTTSRTKNNAVALMKHLGVTAREVDIRPLCLAEWKALGHKPLGIDPEGLDVEGLSAKLRALKPENRCDLVFENVQARVRTNLLMNAGFVIGTGDVSELALGWCTFNADHMSMYNVNVSIPKTLVKFLVGWAAQYEFEGAARETLLDIVATEISPELLPADAAGAIQSTEGTIGPYELHDFFLYHVVRFGAPPEKVLYLAKHAKFDRDYPPERIKHWLGVFLRRFFASQYKRSVLPDGPKVGTVSLSPRGDWRMPSDAVVTAWLAALGE